jgi:hypothetical protein
LENKLKKKTSLPTDPILKSEINLKKKKHRGGGGGLKEKKHKKITF